MRKLQIVIPIAIAVVTVSVFSLAVVFAQGNEEGDSNASKLAIKVAEILGLNAAEVDDAIKQARRELRDETVQNNLNALVEEGRLTQEQADEYLDWIQSKPEGISAIGKHSFGKRGHHRGWKGHGRFFGPRNYFNEKPSVEDVQKKLNAMVEDGYITQEEAEAKLKALQAAKAN
jgi:hypothetical protein